MRIVTNAGVPYVSKASFLSERRYGLSNPQNGVSPPYSNVSMLVFLMGEKSLFVPWGYQNRKPRSSSYLEKEWLCAGSEHHWRDLINSGLA